MTSRQTGVRVEGARELRRSLRKAGSDLQDLRDDAHRPVSTFVAAQARPAAPRLTGRLASSGRPGATKTSAVVRFGGARVPYAGPIHWGWPARNIKAQPWLADTVDRTMPAWSRMYEDAVARVVATIRGANQS